MKKAIYNLEFPDNCKKMTIAGYEFERVSNYQSALQSLSHPVDCTYEFTLHRHTGTHAITAYVEADDRKAVLPWMNPDSSKMNDVMLVLSLLTGREVFSQDVDKLVECETDYIRIDPRPYGFGGIVRASIEYEPSDDRDLLSQYNKAFASTANAILANIDDSQWMAQYRDGYVFHLLRQAFQEQPLESAFIECWTIWEHLFAVLNEAWMSPDQIERLSSIEKLSFILVKFALQSNLDKESKAKIGKLAGLRNKLIHSGRLPDYDHVREDALLFIHLTEFVAAKIMGLFPSNVFNTLEKLEKFMSSKKK